MGRSGTIIRLERDAQAAPLQRLRAAAREFLFDQWDKLLGREGAEEARGWMSGGIDSLLSVGDSEADESVPTDKLAFWFYRNVDWPMSRAEHYLDGALAAGRHQLDETLRRLGYRIAGYCPTRESVLNEHDDLLGAIEREPLLARDCPICRHLETNGPPPTERTRELETLFARIRDARMILLNVDMWEQFASRSASDEERAKMHAESSEASRECALAKSALEGLVARTRAEAPTDLEAWAVAHDAYLAAYLRECDPDGTGAFAAKREREEWAEVRAGTRTLVDEDLMHIPIEPDRYRRLFGIDPRTHERAEPKPEIPRRTLTLMLVKAEDPDDLDAMSYAERRSSGGAPTTFELRHAGVPDVVVRMSLGIDQGVYGAARVWDQTSIESTCCIFPGDVAGAARMLEPWIAVPLALAQRLIDYARSSEDPARVARALHEAPSDPAEGPAEEAATWVRVFMEHVPLAVERDMGIAWELRTPASCRCAVWEGQTLGRYIEFTGGDDFEILPGGGKYYGRMRCVRCSATFGFAISANHAEVTRETNVPANDDEHAGRERG